MEEEEGEMFTNAHKALTEEEIETIGTRMETGEAEAEKAAHSR